MLTANRPAASIDGTMNRPRSIATVSIGGSRLTDARALTVIPSGRSPSSVVTTVTPVGSWPMATRKSRLGSGISAG